jgi:hypothetical protein
VVIETKNSKMKLNLIAFLLIICSCKNQKNDKIITLKNPLKEKKSISISNELNGKEFDDKNFKLELEKIKKHEEKLTFENNHYYIKSENVFFNNKEAIFSLLFLNDTKAKINILEKKNKTWLTKFETCLEIENESFDFKNIKFLNFNETALILIPDGLYRNFENYIITFDKKNSYKLNNKTLSNPEFSNKYNKIYSFHFGGVSKLTIDEFSIEKGSLKEEKIINITLPFNGLEPKSNYEFEIKDLNTNKNIQKQIKYYSNENLFNDTKKIINKINYH